MAGSDRWVTGMLGSDRQWWAECGKGRSFPPLHQLLSQLIPGSRAGPGVLCPHNTPHSVEGAAGFRAASPAPLSTSLSQPGCYCRSNCWGRELFTARLGVEKRQAQREGEGSWASATSTRTTWDPHSCACGHMHTSQHTCSSHLSTLPYTLTLALTGSGLVLVNLPHTCTSRPHSLPDALSQSRACPGQCTGSAQLSF